MSKFLLVAYDKLSISRKTKDYDSPTDNANYVKRKTPKAKLLAL